MTDEQLRAGVVGVGSMGSHHARVYNELQKTELVGLSDTDDEKAQQSAQQYNTEVYSLDSLLSAVDLLSVAVPTRAHHQIASKAIEYDVGVLVEKPFVDNFSDGKDLIRQAAVADVPLAVGHIERFNPVVDVLADILTDVEVIAVTARRLGPPVNRDTNDGVVHDLMIHDIDTVCSLVDDDISNLTAVSANRGDYATTQFEFEAGAICSLTASRITQERIRELSVTTRDFHVTADYMDQSVNIHRHSAPEYQQKDGDVHYTQESVVERPAVDSEEPLKRELRSFAEAVRTDAEPRVTGEDGLRAFSIANKITNIASSGELGKREVSVGDITG